VETLRNKGVERFTSLVYAHKPGLAEYLNDFISELADRFPELILSEPFLSVMVNLKGLQDGFSKSMSFLE